MLVGDVVMVNKGSAFHRAGISRHFGTMFPLFCTLWHGNSDLFIGKFSLDALEGCQLSAGLQGTD